MKAQIWIFKKRCVFNLTKYLVESTKISLDFMIGDI